MAKFIFSFGLAFLATQLVGIRTVGAKEAFRNINAVEAEKFDFQRGGYFCDKQLYDDPGRKIIDKAVESQVNFLDTSREALLSVAGNLRQGKNVTNAFVKVVDGFEKEIANMQATVGRRKVPSNSLRKLAKLIKIASRERKANTRILRALTAKGLFLAQRISRARVKRDARQLSGAIAFLKAIQNEVGRDVFEEYLSISGLVTLIFVIDDSGSMGDDIKAAIAIATMIVRAKRDEEVDYILSPFNDPDTGPVTVKNEWEGEEFITAIQNLRAHSGGDCPELVLKGISDALTSGPQPGSSMHVFTDAPPKNVTAETIHDILSKALDLDIIINFFTKLGCGKPQGVYDAVADQTGGLVYPLKSSVELRELGQLVFNKLRGSVSVQSGGEHMKTRNARATGRRQVFDRSKRALRYTETVINRNAPSNTKLAGNRVEENIVGKIGVERNTVVKGETREMRELSSMHELRSEYNVLLDDSIEDATIAVTTQHSNVDIILFDPQGRMVIEGRVGLRKGVVYNLVHPVPGLYNLIVPRNAVEHRYRVNGMSKTNIDFSHYYAYIPKRGRCRIPVPLEQPLLGIETAVFITVAGSELLQAQSLSVQVVGEDKIVYTNQKPIGVGRSGVRYMIEFNPPSAPFHLELHGKTKKANDFVRVSARKNQAVPVILRQAYTPHSDVLRRGQLTTLRLQVRRGNVGENTRRYTVNIKDQRGYGRVLTGTVIVRRQRIGFVKIELRVPDNAPKGKVEELEVYLTRINDVDPIASLGFTLLIV